MALQSPKNVPVIDNGVEIMNFQKMKGCSSLDLFPIHNSRRLSRNLPFYVIRYCNTNLIKFVGVDDCIFVTIILFLLKFTAKCFWGLKSKPFQRQPKLWCMLNKLIHKSFLCKYFQGNNGKYLKVQRLPWDDRLAILTVCLPINEFRNFFMRFRFGIKLYFTAMSLRTPETIKFDQISIQNFLILCCLNWKDWGQWN